MPTPPAHSALVYLHGWLGSARDWNAVQPLLPGLALDLPGHGAARHQTEAAASLPGAADAVVAAVEAARVERPVLVGYSMGGRVAMTAALRHPGRFRALILESTSPGLRTEAERTARHAVDEARAAQVERDFAGFLHDWYRLPLFASLDAVPGRVAATVAERLLGDPAELARALRGLSVAHQPSYWDRLADLPPTLALAGALDAKYVGIVEAMAAAPTVTARVVPDAGHSIHRERPAAFIETVRTWLAAQ
ncbi:MAG: 2-succinyl-6-hydroxy-2,4-cyclohexadiene-1-carboxylate synthase [Bacteroidota bacterium]